MKVVVTRGNGGYDMLDYCDVPVPQPTPGGQFLDLLGIRLDPERAQGPSFTVNLITPDNGERFVVELSNGTLTNLEGFLADDPAQLDGDVGVLLTLADMLVHFSPAFEITPGTHSPDVRADDDDDDPFTQEPLADSGGG